MPFDSTDDSFAITGDRTLKIHYMHGAPNPREDMDFLGTVAVKGGLGDEEPDAEEQAEIEKTCIWLPVYRYEHSGTALNTTGFNCPWDSALTGYIYVEKTKVREEWDVKRISPKLREKVLANLRAEIELLSQWANGEVYGYTLHDADGEEIDSCWGFYGDDPRENGMMEYIDGEIV